MMHLVRYSLLGIQIPDTARIEHVLIVKVYFERRKIVKVFMTHVQDFFQKSLSEASFERKLSSVSLPLSCDVNIMHCDLFHKLFVKTKESSCLVHSMTQMTVSLNTVVPLTSYCSSACDCEANN